ncbi:MAG: restriction endonuclease subunit S [Caldisericota bacterium]|nr:restriction endonuclease subunit S [Caldisericota bacterium]MEA3431907.1 restriction endonuclease subunit S [candidate division WOR-3 bacterium]
MKKEFKQPGIGRIPKEWAVVKVRDVGEVITGTTPSTKITEYWGEGYPFVTPTDFSDSKYVYETERSVTLKGAKAARLIPKDSVMVTCIASVGEVSMAAKECITNQQINTIVCNEKTNPYYIYYIMAFKKNDLRRWAGITTSPIIKKSLFEEFPLPLPPLPEQKKIAEILGTVDKAIEKVEQAIEKADRLKKGLMQELLTKGIGHKEFKESEIGRIPKEWEVVKLGDKDVSNLIIGQSPPSSTYNKKGEGLPFLQGKAEFGEIHPTPLLYCSRPIKIAEKNDVLLSVRAPVGDVNIASLKSCIGRGLTAIRPKNNRLYYLYLFYYLIFKKRVFKSLSTGSTFKAIRRSEIENYLIPLPSLPEQQKIAEILDTVDKRLEVLKAKKQKFERIKKGLMNDLLTGRKRVKV